MSEDIVLLEKREELKRQIAMGEYKTLAHIILDGTGNFIQKLTRNPAPISFWYSAVVIELVILLIGTLTSLLLGETYSLEMVIFGTWGVGMGISSMIVVRTTINMAFTTWNEIYIDSIESVKDLDDQREWLTAGFNVKKHLLGSIAIGLLIGLPILIIWAMIKGASIGFGAIIINLALAFQGGMAGSYIMFVGLTAIGQPGRYQFKLYAADPSSSEIFDRISDTNRNISYLGAVYLAIFTFGIIIFEIPINLAFLYLVLTSWGPLTGYFVGSHIFLSKAITKAKWKKLNEIQAKIKRLEAQEDIPTKETLEHLGKLMDYHDRIKATRNSALNLRAGLSFLNSLLLPLIAFLLSNLDKVLKIFF